MLKSRPPPPQRRGPIGGYFVWEPSQGGPLQLVAGGSGVVPLMTMLRHRAATRSTVPARLLYSARSREDVIYARELRGLADADEQLDVTLTLTRSAPDGWEGYRRRIDLAMLGEAGWAARDDPLAYVCGPTPLVEVVASDLVEIG